VTVSYFVISIACDYRYLDFLDLAAMTAALYCCRPPKKFRVSKGAFSG